MSRPDGSSVITKHPDTGGLVSPGTVTAQLLYEIAEPGYANPDVVAHFDTVTAEQDGPDRVPAVRHPGQPRRRPRPRWRSTSSAATRNHDDAGAGPGWTSRTRPPGRKQELFGILGGRQQFGRRRCAGCCASTGPTRPRTSRPPRTCGSRSRTPTRVRSGRRFFSNATMELALGGTRGFHTTTPPAPEARTGSTGPRTYGHDTTGGANHA